MIPIHEFISEMRRTLEQEAAKATGDVSGGACFRPESADTTALMYAHMCGFLRGMARSREILNELVKRINEGGV